jgi:hypothetical protein
VREDSRNGNNSILYLALLTLVYFLYVSGLPYFFHVKEAASNTNGKTYIEIDYGRYSVVKTINNPNELQQIDKRYYIEGNQRADIK